MKRIAIAALFITLLNTVLAQTKSSPLSVEAKVGVSIPVGKFSDKSLNKDGQSPSSAWAKPGPALQIVVNYTIHINYGVSLLLGGQQNSQDETTVTNYLRSNSSYPSDATFTTNAKAWKIGQILGGGFLKLPVLTNNKLFFNANIRAGVLKTALPGYAYTVSGNQNGMPALLGYGSQQSQKLPWAFCYQLVVGTEYQFAKYLYATIDISYADAAASFNYTKVTNFPANPVYTQYKTRYPVAAISALAGIGFKF